MSVKFGRVYVLEPLAIFYDFNTGEPFIAQRVMREQQKEECPNVEPLSYHEDPLIVVPDALVVKIDGKDDLVFADTNHDVTYVLWESCRGTFVVPVGHCYDYETMRKVA